MVSKLFYQPKYLGLLSLALFGLAQFATIALYPAIAEKLQLPISDVVLSFTIGSLIFIWGSRFWSQKSDITGRARVLGYGLLGLSFSLIALVGLDSTPALITSRLIYGFTASGIVSVVQAWWRDSSGNTTKKMFTHSIGLNVGRLLAPVFIWALAGNLELILIVLALMIFVVGVLSLIGSQSEEKNFSQSCEEKTVVGSSVVYLAFFSASLIGLVHSLLASRLQITFSLSSTETSVLCSKILMMSGVLVVFLQLILRKISNLSAYLLISVGFVSWFFFGVIFSQFSSPLESWIMIVFFSIGLSTLMPGCLSLVSPGGKAAGAIVSVQSLGLCFGQGLGFLELKDILSLEILLASVGVLMGATFGKMLQLRRVCA